MVPRDLSNMASTISAATFCGVAMETLPDRLAVIGVSTKPGQIVRTSTPCDSRPAGGFGKN